MPTKSLRAPSNVSNTRGGGGGSYYGQSPSSSHRPSSVGGAHASAPPHPHTTSNTNTNHEMDDEVQCLRDVVGALGGVLDSSVAMTRDSEQEALELLELLGELFEAIDDTLDAAFNDRGAPASAEGEASPSSAGQTPAAVVERVAARMGTLLHRGQPLQTLSRFLPLRLTVSTKLRDAVLHAILAIVGCAAHVERLTMELECFGAGTFNAHASGRHATSAEEFTRRVDEGMEALAPTDTLIASCVAHAFKASDGERHLQDGGGGDGMGERGVQSPFGRSGGMSSSSGGASDRELPRLLLCSICDDSAGVSETTRALAAEVLFLAHHHWGFLVEQSLCPVLMAPNDTPSTTHAHAQFRGLPMQHQRLGVLLRFAFHEPCSDSLRAFLCGIVRLVAKRKPEILIPAPRPSGSTPFGTSGAPMSPSQLLITFLDPASAANRPYFDLLESLLNSLERLDNQRLTSSNNNAGSPTTMSSSGRPSSAATPRVPSLQQKQHASILSHGRCYVLVLECLADMLAVVHTSKGNEGDQHHTPPHRRQNNNNRSLSAPHQNVGSHTGSSTDCTGHGSWYWPDIASNTQFADGFRRLMDATLRLQSQFQTDVPPTLPEALLGPIEKRGQDDVSMDPIIDLEGSVFEAALKVAKAALLLEGRYQGPTRTYPYGSQDPVSGTFERPCDLILFKQLSGVVGPSAILPAAGTRNDKLSTSERYNMSLASTPAWKNSIARAQNASYFNSNFFSGLLQAAASSGGVSSTLDRSVGHQQRLSSAVAELPKKHRGMERLRLLRFAVAHAFSRQATKMVAAAFEAGFESLSSAMIAAQEQLKMEPHRKKAFIASLQETTNGSGGGGGEEPVVDHPSSLLVPQGASARIAAVAASSSDRLAEALLVESTLLSSLVLSKCPQARSFVRRTVSGFDSWSLNLFSLMDSVLQHPKVQRSVTQYLVIVDSFQCILNDGEQASQIDVFDGKRIAHAMIREQERRQFQWDRQLMEEQLRLVRADESIGGMPPEDIIRHYRTILTNLEINSCFGLDTTTIQYFLSQGNGVFRAQRRPYTPQIAELSFVLAQEVLLAATRATFLGDRDSAAVSHDDEAASYDNNPHHNGSSGIVGVVRPSAAEGAFGMQDGRNGGEDAAARARRLRTASPRPGTASARATAVAKERPMGTSYDRWMAEKHGGHHHQHSPSKTSASRAIVNAIVPKKKKEPFRPTSTAKHRDLNPAAARTTSPSASHTKGNSALNGSRGGESSKGGCAMSLQEVISATEHASDANEYLSVAITMHLPVKFGPHYHRAQKAAVRQVRAPSGQIYVQPVHRNSAQSWSAEDVFVGELYVLFIPFHRLSLTRVDDEIETVRRHLLDVRKKLVTTPATQRSRRWFLTDMLNHVLPKTEILLHELRQLLDYYTADDVRYQLSVIRTTDEMKRHKEDVFEAAVEDSDTAMPRDVLRLSTGRFKDVVHSGNLLFAIHRLKDLYQRKQHRRASGNGGVEGDDDIYGAYSDPYDLGGTTPAMESPERAALRMRELERHLAHLGDDGGGLLMGDDTESVYDGLVSARQEAPQHRIATAPSDSHLEYEDESVDDRQSNHHAQRPDFDPDPDWYNNASGGSSKKRASSSAFDINDLKAFADAAYQV